MHRFSVVVVAALALGFVASVRGEEPNVKEILTKVDATSKALKGVTYKAESWLDGPDKDRATRVSATVSLKRAASTSADQSTLPFIRAEVTAKPPGDRPAEEMLLIHDGKEAISATKRTKTFQRVKSTENSGAMAAFQRVFFQEYTHPTPFSDELNAESTRYEGKKSINGVECHVIWVRYSQQAQEARWYFGIADSLPRRVDRLQGEGAQVLEVADLKADPTFDDKTFALIPPEGYEDDSPGLLAAGRAAPAFTLNTADGKAVSLAELKGKVVVLDFWASWSAQCKAWMPIVQKTAEKYKDKDVVFFGVNSADNKDIDAGAFMKEKGCTYPALVKGDEVAKAYRANVPTAYVIGRDGKVAFSMWRFKPDDPENEAKFVAAIEKALAAK